MNNKFIARIAAVAIGATMLSTAVFASNATLSDDKGKLDFSDTTSSDTYVTMMAYATDRDLTNETVGSDSYAEGDAMIALEQVSGTTGLGEVKIDSSKLSGKKHIVVKIGGGASPASILLNAARDFVKVLDGTTVANEEVTIGETKYTGIRTKTGEYTPESGENVTEVGVVFTKTSDKSEVNTTTDSDTNIVVRWDGTIEGEGKITFGAGLMGVPTDKTVYAFPYVKSTN